MKQYLLFLFTPLLFLLHINTAFAQGTVSGVVTDTSGTPIPAANVVIKGTAQGASADFDGNFALDVASFPATLVVSSVGFEPKEVNVTSPGQITVVLSEGVELDEVILLGNKAKPRTILDSPVPIDNIGVKELKGSGQLTVDKMLTYKVPSYNSSNQTVSDATAHFDPAELRGLGPSRTLVLINGKRKNPSALVYINDTPGKGEVGTDMKSVSVAAIERVQVLRDGASAQYGSDAIAGVVNLVLKKNTDYTEVNASSGITTEGDGFTANVDFNTGINIFKENGYFNVSAGYYHQDTTNRAGEPGGDGLFGFLYDIGAIPIGAAGGFEATPGVPATGAQILSGDTDWQRENPNLGMTIGQPEMDKFDAFYNLGYDISEKATLYSFGGGTYRIGKSFALYRIPWWPGIQTDAAANPLYDGEGQYQGFQPTFETNILDLSFDLGLKGILFKDLNFDLSTGVGLNTVDYEVNNSINTSLGANSPTTFDPGGYEFKDWVSNLDLSKTFGELSASLGVEFRYENYVANGGEEASYIDGGVQSFPGLQPLNEVDEDRTNIGAYLDLAWDITDDFLIGGAVRREDYSDFGDNTSWKLNARLKSWEDKLTIRTSVSTGFRAPSLHQIYLSNIQTLVSGGTISNQGTFNNEDSVIRNDLGVPQLKAETSRNFTAGIALRPAPRLSIAVDYYWVGVEDRVLFTGEIGYKDGIPGEPPTNPVEVILDANDITSLKFFANAVNTVTQGVDFVFSYNDIKLGNLLLNTSLSANFNETYIRGAIDVPEILADNGYTDDFFNRKEQSRIISARPKQKVILGLNFDYNKLAWYVNNTYFGEVTWQHASNSDNDQTFSGKVLTDVGVSYAFTDKISANISANNLFDIYPDEIDAKGDFNTDLGGRFRYPWEVNQFGFSGTILQGGLTFKF